MRDDAHADDGGTGALAGVLGVGAVFLIALVYGYSTAFMQWAPLWLALLLGFLIWGIAIALAIAMAHASLNRGWASLMFFPLLVVVSAFGAINALMYLFDGDEIVANRIRSARGDYVRFTEEAVHALKVPELEEKRQALTAQLENLKQQITEGGGGTTCGIGDEARKVIEEINKILPPYEVVPWQPGIHDCKQQPELAAIYKRQEDAAWKNFRALPAYRTQDFARRQDLAVQITEEANRQLGALEALGKSSSTASAADYVTRTRYDTAKGTLETAARSYAALFARVQELTRVTLKAPSSLEIDDVRGLGNIGHVVKNLVRRNDANTWLFVFVAVLLDAFMVLALRRYIRARAPRERTPTALTPGAPRYLWSHEG